MNHMVVPNWSYHKGLSKKISAARICSHMLSPKSESPGSLGSPKSSSRPKNAQSAHVADCLRDEILRGQYRSGERLPSERDLAARFQVTRGCIREAFRTLEQLGVASIRPGGTRVSTFDSASLDIIGPLLALQDPPDPQLVKQVQEVFSGLTVLAAQLAIERGQTDGEARIRAQLEKIRQANSAHDLYHSVHELAHIFLNASENLVLRLIRNALRRGIAVQFNWLEETADLPLPPRTQYMPAVRDLEKALKARDAVAGAEAFQRLQGLLKKKRQETQTNGR